MSIGLALAQTNDTIEEVNERPTAVKKKKSGKRHKGKKKKSAQGNIDNPDADIEFESNTQTLAIESSGSAWVFLFSMITFLGGVVFWYRRHQAAESAKHLSDLNFGNDAGSLATPQTTTDAIGTEKSSSKKKHPLETEQPVFVSTRLQPSTDSDQNMIPESKFNQVEDTATLLILPDNDDDDGSQHIGPHNSTKIIIQPIATKIVTPETVETKPIKKV